MKLLKINLLGILLTLSYSVFCQSVYRSSTFENAVTNKTRTLTGLPGEKYVNNFAEYKITATFNPQTHILEGEEFVTYHANMDGYYNDRIYMNLYRNIYKKGALRTRPCSPDDITDEGMEILEIKRVTKSGGQDDVFFYVSNTSLVIAPGKFSKGDKVTLYVRWRNKIAANTKHRGGKYNDNSWFIPYWYPQIAVFDDVYGWDNVAHTGNEEFLFEFANYDVNITVGEKMYVWATGELLNKTDIYSKNVLDLYAKAQKSDSEISIVNSANRETGLKKAENTWHFKADSVPDFAFCCSSDADWTGSSVQLTKNQKRTFTSAVHHSKGFSYVIPMTKKTLAYLSTQRPGVPYPYPHLTIFEGGGGMEFDVRSAEFSELGVQNQKHHRRRGKMRKLCSEFRQLRPDGNAFVFADTSLDIHRQLVLQTADGLHVFGGNRRRQSNGKNPQRLHSKLERQASPALRFFQPLYHSLRPSPLQEHNHGDTSC